MLVDIHLLLFKVNKVIMNVKSVFVIMALIVLFIDNVEITTLSIRGDDVRGLD